MVNEVVRADYTEASIKPKFPNADKPKFPKISLKSNKYHYGISCKSGKERYR